MSELALIQQLWAEHVKRPFPSAMAGEDFEGEDLVLIDSSAAGCVSAFLDSGGAHSLDVKRLRVLDDCAHTLSRICPKLPNEHRAYFDALRELSQRVVKYCGGYLR
jgi:hypothetical protein